MTSRLASLLVQDGLVSAKKMAEAFQRQVIYGGTLDTILLEMDVIDEGTLLDALGRSSAMPIAGDLPSLEQLQAADVQKWMPLPLVERYRAVPVGLDGSVLRVLVIDPPDRKQLDELGYTLSLNIEPIIVPEHRFVQAVELVYGVAVPARFASLAAKLRQRATDPNRAKLVPTQPALPVQPLRERHENAPIPVGDRIKEGTPTEPQRVAPVHRPATEAMTAPERPMPAAPHAELARADAGEEPRRAVVTDVPMPGRMPAPAPAAELPDQPTPRMTTRQPSAPSMPVAPEAAMRVSGAAAASDATPLGADEARRAIDDAGDRDAIFEALCRGARARLPFAAILTVHGDIAAGRIALGATWFDKNALGGVSVSLDKPSPFRAAAIGRAPYLGRVGDDVHGGMQVVASLGRKAPLPAVLIPIVLRERAVALLYADNDGNELDADVVAELSTLVAAAARSFQRLILRAKGAEYAKAPAAGLGKLAAGAPAEEAAAGGAWRKADEGGGRARATNPRFGAALMNMLKSDVAAAGAAAAGANGPSSSPEPREAGVRETAEREAARAPVTREESAPLTPLHDALTEKLPDVDGLLASVERQDDHARMAADALVAIGERAAAALVARLPGPLRLDRHTLRGPTPPMADHGPLLAVLARMGRTAREPLLGRLGDSSLEVRYYATLALGELRSADVVQPLGTRLYDPDAGVRRAAVEALTRFGDSSELRALVEQLRGELPGPDGVRQRYAAEALGVLKDVAAVPRLIELVKHADGAVVSAARKALVEITKQDFGTSRWRWRSWWDRHRGEPRVEWMLEGLAHAEPEVRLSASEELRGMSNEYFGYAFDLPKREREDARKKWVDWWRTHGSKLQDKR